jgi:protein ImuB
VPYRVRLRFPDPIGAPEDIAAALDRLLARLCDRLIAEDRGARRLDWLLVRADGTEQRLSVGVARPARDAARLARLFEEKIKTVAPGDGIDSMLLAAPVVEDFEADQDGLTLDAAPASEANASGDPVALTTIVDRLTNRLGSENVFRLAPVDSHLPDRAQDRAPAMPHRKTAISWPETGPRPTRLLHNPHPIEPLTAAKGLDAPTAFRVFGRRSLLRVIRGPERIAPEWWRPDAAWRTGPRDYFDVEDTEGRRFWIYRDNATGPARDRRWYLHGLF